MSIERERSCQRGRPDGEWGRPQRGVKAIGEGLGIGFFLVAEVKGEYGLRGASGRDALGLAFHDGEGPTSDAPSAR